jgi:hypothetical protein
MDQFAASVNTLFPVHLILSSSDRCNQLLQERFRCTAGSLLRLFPDVNDITGCIRDPASSTIHPVSRVRIDVVDLESLSRPPLSSDALRRRLQQCVAAYDSDDEAGDSTPWYETWKQTFLQNQERSDHDFVGSFFGSVFVLLSDELDHFKEILTQLQSRINALSIKLFFSSFMRFFIILNPLSLRSYDVVSSEPSFREFVSCYGMSNCFWFDILQDEVVVSNEDYANSTPISHISTGQLSDPLSPLTEHPPSEINGHLMEHENEIDKKVPEILSSKPVVSQSLLLRSEQCLRQLIESTLIPWTEKQMKFLYDAVSARKGLRKSIKQLLGMAPTSGLMRGATSYIYKLESDEMQNRKLADMAMSLGLYEMAFKYYHTARDEFRADGACLYFAGASEMTAVSAFLVNKFQKHYFDQAISTYQDVCKAFDLASRCTLLATDCMRQPFPNDAALFFIRMTSEDSDLRSGLFLEQAAVCFEQSLIPRHRKASFHFVLAGHRYNKCGLKRHALRCYRKFRSKCWSAAIEHVDFTVARLCIQLAASSNEKCTLRRTGLEILRSNSEKVLFFQELVTEVTKRDSHSGSKQIRFLLNVPFIKSFRMEPIEGSLLTKGVQSCFLREKVTFHFQLYSPFELNLSNLRLVTTTGNTESSRMDVTLTAGQEKCVTLCLIPKALGDFEIVGLEYETINDLRARFQFSDKLANKFCMTATKALPPLTTNIRIGNNSEDADAVEMLTGEISDFVISVSLTDETGWRPTRILLHSNAEITGHGDDRDRGIALQFGIENNFQIRAPTHSRSQSFYFRIEYFDDNVKERRCMTRNMELFVRECLAFEGLVEGVLSLRNTLSVGPVTLQSEDETVDLWPGLTAHILVRNSSIKWKSGVRQGFLNPDSWC